MMDGYGDTYADDTDLDANTGADDYDAPADLGDEETAETVEAFA